MERRYIFLDVDGVLNCVEHYEHLRILYSNKDIEAMDTHDYHLDEYRVRLLNRLVGSEVVLITSWSTDVCMKWLPKKGLELPIIGAVTPRELQHRWLVRGNSIAEWFDEYYGDIPRDSFVDSFDEDGWWRPGRTYSLADGRWSKDPYEGDLVTYVILDDCADMLMDQKNHFIHIDSHAGLTIKDIRKAAKILNIRL